MSEPIQPSQPALRVLFTASEADPLVKVGGLGDVTGSLPRALRDLSAAQAGGQPLDVRLVIPFHPVIAGRIAAPHRVANLRVPHPTGALPAQAYLTEIDGLPVYLIGGGPIAAAADVYSLDTRADGEKYTFFSLAVLELARALNWQPHILHANDWHTALAVHMLRAAPADGFFDGTRSVLSIHNLPFMGGGTELALAAFGIPPVNDPRLPEWGGYQPLPMGMSAADVLTTVSPTYAREIMTPAFGSGLEYFLQMRAGSLIGILNGLDEALWDPATDGALAQKYSAAKLARRAANKQALLAEMRLPAGDSQPLIIFIGRMDSQKGIGLAVEALRQVADLPWQAVLLGTGDPGLQDAVRALEAAYPERVRAAIRFDAQLSRRMYAGGDMLLMPSRYEPCGLAQMIAMRYGCLPVARATGGLRDTVLDGPEPEQSTGFLFEEAAPEALAQALRRALAAYDDPDGWQARQRFGMRQDFSWQGSAQKYARLYHKLLD